MNCPFTEQQQILLGELFRSGAILTGDAVRDKFGLRSPIYLDLREGLYAHPELLWKVGGEFVRKICELTRDHPAPQCVAGIPDTATPLALAAALYACQTKTQPPITFALLRKEGKQYPGLPTSHWIGSKDAGCEYNLIDDVVASGLTKRAAAAKMRQEGIPLRRIIVLFDRQQGDGLREEGFDLHAVFRLTDVLDFYLAENLIRPEEHRRIVEFLASRRFDTAPVSS